MRTPLTVGLIAQLALLTALAASVSLSVLGWVVGIGCGVFTTVALGRGLTRSGARQLTPANRVTLARAVLVGGVAALTADSFVRPTPVPLLVAMSAVALALDAVDGWVARRSGTVTPLGARFDMEVDAFLILVLCAYVARSTGQWWLLCFGAARYGFVAAGRLLPWLRGTLPPRYWCKVVAAIQGIVLTVAAADVIPLAAMNALLVISLGLLAESFGRDVWWLHRHRRAIVSDDAAAGSGTMAVGRPADVDAEPVPADVDAEPVPASAGRSRVRIVAAWATTILACLLVWFALVAPNDINALTPGAFLRLPVEGLVLVAVALVLPPPARRVLAAVVGVVLGLLTILKLLDMGFFEALDRPFNPVADWTYGGSAVGVLSDSIGDTGAIAVVIAAAGLAIGLLVVLPLAVVRLTRLTCEHRGTSIRVVTAVGAGWILCAVFGLQVAGGAPIASAGAAGLAYDQLQQVRDGIRDQEAFADAVDDDSLAGPPVAGTSTPAVHAPGAGAPKPAAAAGRPAAAAAVRPPAAATTDPALSGNALTGLRGKDVIVAFVESYGRVAVQGSTFSAKVDATLDAGTTTLTRSGFSAKSAFLTSPTFGGISWLAHSTLQSGLWVDNQLRYDKLVASKRTTLTSTFQRAGWRTVADVPANEKDWPEGGSFYHYDKIYDASNVGYQGPDFSYAPMPDQYVLSAFQRAELAPKHAPVMAEIDLISSHWPWTPLPRLVDWSDVGDGSIFDPMPAESASTEEVWSDPARVKAAYGQSVQYSINTLVSFVQRYGNDNLVLVVLGDHQPAAVVSGDGATHDVPISIIAHDPAVLQRISGWGWQDGLRPDPQAPVWPMDSFRNRFLAAYQ